MESEQIEREIKLQKFLCQKVNCINRTLFGTVFSLLVSSQVVLGKSFTRSEGPLLCLLLPLLLSPLHFPLNASIPQSFVFILPLFSSFKFSNSVWWISPTPFASALAFLIKTHAQVQTQLNVPTVWHRVAFQEFLHTY